MNPKEKANNLLEQFDNTLTYLESKNIAKQCALIAVDEVLGLLLLSQAEINYWENVKQEIEKL